MIFLLALIPATALTVAGYVALFLSHRSDGALKTFGRYLGIWAFVLAAAVVLGGMFAAGHLHHVHAGMWGAHDGMHCPFMDRRDEDRMWERHDHVEPPASPEGPAPGGQPSPPPPSK